MEITEQPLTDEQQAELRIHELAQFIQNEKQLRAILKTGKIGLRKSIYEKLLPHLSFVPCSYRELMLVPKIKRHA
jgi:hypothetical protein